VSKQALASQLRRFASLLRSICGPAFPSARVLLIDIHGEYAAALKPIATVFRVNPAGDEQPLFIPYWAIDPHDLFDFLTGALEDKAYTAVLDRVQTAKLAIADKFNGVDVSALTASTPLPFSFKKLWLDLIDPEVKTWADTARTERGGVDRGVEGAW
jgi:hypothetical protein